MKKLCLPLIVIAALGLTACGDKNKTATASSATNRQGESVSTLPAISNQLGAYQLIDFGKNIQFKQFLEYRNLFVRVAASDESYDAKKFPEFAIMEIGSEMDAFKREDLIKKYSPEIAEIRRSSIKKLVLTDSSENGNTMGGTVSRYDMEREIYTIGFSLNGFHIGYDWQDKGQSYSYSFLLDTPSISYVPMGSGFSVEVKVPKDQAREIEAKLAPLRGSGDGSVNLPADFYVSAGKIDQDARWEHASVHTNLQAVGLRLKGQSVGTPLIFIDGPQLTRKK